MGKRFARKILCESLEQRVYLSGTVAAHTLGVDANSSQGSVRYRTFPVLQSVQANMPTNAQSPTSPAQTFFNALILAHRDTTIGVAVDAAATLDLSGLGANLSVLGSYSGGGESNLAYSWSVTSEPSGASPQFSINGTNAAKQTVVTFDRAGEYTFTVLITTDGHSATDSVTLDVDQTLTAIAVTPGSLGLNLNGTEQFAASALDQFGMAMVSQPAFSWSQVSGVGSISGGGLYIAGTAAGGAVISAASGGVSGTTSVTVSNAAPTIAISANAGANTVTGTSTTLSVLGADDGGETGLTYAWSATNEPTGAAPVFTINGTNAAKNTNVTFNKAGAYTFRVTVSDGTLSVTSSVNVTVNQTLAAIVVTPGTISLTLNQPTTFTAVGFDQFGVAMASQPTFTWSKVSGVGSVNGTGAYNSGTAGSATISAASGGITGTASVTVSNASPTVTTAATAGTGTVTGTSTTLSVLGADDGGENGLTYTWSATNVPAGAAPVFTVNGTNGAKNTTVTFNKAGSYTFLVTISDGAFAVSSSVSLTVNQTLASIVVTPGSVGMNHNQSTTLSAAGFDQFGAALASQPAFTWSKVSGVGSVTGAVYNSGATAGNAVISASNGGVSGTASISVTNTGPSVATAASAGTGTVTGTSTTLSVLGADDGGENGLTYTWAATSSPAGAAPAFTINGTNASKNTNVTFNKAGAYTFRVTVSDGTSSVTSSVNVTVNQTLASIVVTPGTIGLNLNQSTTFSAAAFDQFGVAMAVQPAFTWSKVSGVGSISGAGLYAAGAAAGGAVISAASGGVSGTTSVTVTNAAPTIAISANAGANTVTGTSTTLSALGADDGGESGLTYAWSATNEPAGAAPMFTINGTNAAKNTNVTFNKAGAYTFRVTVSDGTLSVTSSVNVTVNQTLASIVVTPGTIGLNLNQSTTFSAAGIDQFGAAMVSQPTFTWSKVSGVGSVIGTVTYSSGTAGSATISAASGGVTGTASVTVTNAGPTVATAASAGSGTVTGTSTTLSVLGADDGGENGLTYTWSATNVPAGASPAFSANGTNGAKNTTVTFNKAGSYTFLVTISDGAFAVSSSVSLTVNQTLTSIAVTPGTVALSGNATQQYSATGSDQFGIVLASQPIFAWSVTGGGAISSTGLLTAPATSANCTIIATSGSVSGTGSASITATGGNPVTITTRALASFTELVITGTSSVDSILVTQSGNTFTITSNGTVQTISGTFGDMKIFAGPAGGNITVDSSVTINNMIYGGAGVDTITDHALASYNAIITVGGSGADTVTGNGVNTDYWADASDTVNASATETSGGLVNKISAFYQPWTTDTTSPDYVPLALGGQNLRDPTDTGAVVHYPQASMWGVTPTFWDVQQGGLSDCFLLADIQSLAISRPAKLEALAVDLGDGTYAVEFKRSGVTSVVRVDGDFSAGEAYLGASGLIWPLVFEKAYALFRTGQNTFSSLNQGDTGSVFTDLGIANTGIVTQGSPATVYATISTALAAGKAVALMSLNTIPGGVPIIANHAYSVMSITQVGSGFNIVLRNPWGFDGAGFDSNPLDGIITLTGDQLKQAFWFGYAMC